MQRVAGHIGVLLIGLLMISSVAAATELAGEIGIDLKDLTYKTDYSDTSASHSIRRSQSNHYANLLLSGALINSHFANYSTNLKVYGAYFNSSTNDATETEYVKPDLRGFYGQATFLPEKKFPFQIYRSDYDDYAVRYEPNNKTDRERLQPELSVIRRYQNRRESTGAVWQYSPREKVRLLSEVKEEKTRSNRIYDFGENLDVWVTYITSAARPWDTVYTVLLDNQLPNAADIQIVNLDSVNVNPGFPVLNISDMPSNTTQTVYLYPGRTEIQVASTGYNPYFNIFEVDSNFVIAIKYRNPASPNDIDQTRKVFTSRLKVGDDDSRARNSVFYEYSDQSESVQKQSTYLNSLSNQAGYTISDNLKVDGLTSYQTNRTRIDTVSLQWNRVLTHQTTLSYLKRQGLSGSIMHMFARNSSHIANPSLPPEAADSDNDTLSSTSNSILGRLTYPSRKWNHRFDLNTNINMLSDNTGYANNQYSGEVSNSLQLWWGGAKWQPRHSLKYTNSSQKNPSQSSQEIETRFSIIGEKSTSVLGDVRLKSEATYRNRWDDVGTDIKSRYVIDVMMMRKFGTGYRVNLLANQEWEVSGGSAPSLSGSAASSKTRYKSAYKLDINASPHKDINLTSSIMLIKQGDNSINKYGLSVNSLIPVVKLPLKSVFVGETRKLAGADPRNQYSVETKVSHRIRKISIVIQHVYQWEKLEFETYSVNEIQGKISRQFNVL